MSPLLKRKKEKEKKEKIPFTTTSKIIKYLGIHLTKKVTDEYTAKYKIVMKVI